MLDILSEFSKQTQIVLRYLAKKFDTASPKTIRDNIRDNMEWEKAVSKNRTDIKYLKNYTEEEFRQYTVECVFDSSPQLSESHRVEKNCYAYYVPNKLSELSAIKKANAEYNAWLSKCSWGGSLFSLAGTAVSATTSLMDTFVSGPRRVASTSGSNLMTSYGKDIETKPRKLSSKITATKKIKDQIKNIALNTLKKFKDESDIKNLHIAVDKTTRVLTYGVLKYIPKENRLYIEIPVSGRWVSRMTPYVMQLPSNSDDQKHWTIDQNTGKVKWISYRLKYTLDSEQDASLGITLEKKPPTTQPVPFDAVFREFNLDARGETVEQKAYGKLLRGMYLIEVNGKNTRNIPYDSSKVTVTTHDKEGVTRVVVTNADGSKVTTTTEMTDEGKKVVNDSRGSKTMNADGSTTTTLEDGGTVTVSHDGKTVTETDVNVLMLIQARPCTLKFMELEPSEYTALSQLQVAVTSEPDKEYLNSIQSSVKTLETLGGKRLRARSRHKHHCTRRRHAKNLTTHTNRAPVKDRRMGGMHPVSLVKKGVTDVAGYVQRKVRDNSPVSYNYRTFRMCSATSSNIDTTFDAAFEHAKESHKRLYKYFLTAYQKYYAVREGELWFTDANQEHKFLMSCEKRLQYVYPHNVTGTKLINHAMMQDKVFRHFILGGTDQCTTSVTDIWKSMGVKFGTMFKEPFPFTLSTSRGQTVEVQSSPVVATIVNSPAEKSDESVEQSAVSHKTPFGTGKEISGAEKRTNGCKVLKLSNIGATGYLQLPSEGAEEDANRGSEGGRQEGEKRMAEKGSHKLSFDSHQSISPPLHPHPPPPNARLHPRHPPRHHPPAPRPPPAARHHPGRA